MSERDEGHPDISRRRVIIDQQTLVPLGIMTGIVGAVVWLTALYVQGNANAAAIVEMRKDQAAYNQNTTTIMIQMAEIKGQIQLLGAQGGQVTKKNAQ